MLAATVCGVGASTMLSVSTLVVQCSRLRELFVGANDIGNGGVALLADALAKATSTSLVRIHASRALLLSSSILVDRRSSIVIARLLQTTTSAMRTDWSRRWPTTTR